MRIENSFQTCQFNWPATKKCIRFCRKIKLCHKQGKNKSRCHTQSHTHRHSHTHTHSLLPLAPPTPPTTCPVCPSTPVERFGLVACHFVAIKSSFINKQTCLERCFQLPPPCLRPWLYCCHCRYCRYCCSTSVSGLFACRKCRVRRPFFLFSFRFLIFHNWSRKYRIEHPGLG